MQGFRQEGGLITRGKLHFGVGTGIVASVKLRTVHQKVNFIVGQKKKWDPLDGM